MPDGGWRRVLTTETVERWLAEDVDHRDVMNDVPGGTTGRLMVKETAVAAGFDVAIATFDSLGIEAEKAVAIDDTVESGDEVLWVDGDVRNVLRGERVTVDVVDHASDVATTIREVAVATHEVSNSVRVAATRKTTPDLHGVEKRTVVAGGDDTHHLMLLGAMMVKNNHIAEFGLETVVHRSAGRKSFAAKLEVGVETLEMGGCAATAGADTVLSGSLPPETVHEGVSRLPEGVISEASGDVTLGTPPAYADIGVDVVSMG